MLPERRARIIAHQSPDPLRDDPPLLSFEWDGPLGAPVEISWTFERHLSHPRFPFRLKKLESRPWDRGDVYVRTDIPPFPRIVQWLELRWLAHCKEFNRLEGRIVLTCYIWGIGHVSPGEYPTWGCLGRRREYGRP